MKKIKVFIFALLFMLPVSVFADDNPSVLTLEAEANDSVISYEGTTQANVTAVMCKLYNDANKEVDMLSVAVENNAFEGTFNVAEVGDYKVTCANYESGSIKEASVTVSEITIPTYTVTFNTNGGSAINDAVVNAGANVNKPENPTKANSLFIGWYEDSTLTTPFDFKTPITDDTMIYAKWQSVVVVHTVFFGEGGTYIVDFATDYGEYQGPLGASITNSSMYSVPTGVEMTLTAQSIGGHHFKGWYSVHEVDNNGNMEWEPIQLLSSESVYTFVPTGTPYIEPVFEEDEIFHTVSYNTTGGSNIPDEEVAHDGVAPQPENPHRDGSVFAGWYADETLTTPYDFETRVKDNLTIYAKWEEEPDNREEYTVADEGGNSISFKEEEGHEYNFALIDLSQLNDEELAELTNGELTREDFNAALEVLKEAVSDEGTFVAIYEIIVVDENDHQQGEGPFDIKIKMTDEMKKYNSFKLLYVDTDNGFNVEETITLTAKDGYLVGRLPHLSSYVLVGNVVNNNPKTFDNIYVWVMMLLISFIGITVSIISTKKIQKKKAK